MIIYGERGGYSPPPPKGFGKNHAVGPLGRFRLSKVQGPLGALSEPRSTAYEILATTGYTLGARLLCF
jgi:hypothetical protein